MDIKDFEEKAEKADDICPGCGKPKAPDGNPAGHELCPRIIQHFLWKEERLANRQRLKTPVRLFLTNKLSNWTQADMVIGGTRYNCVEQWMMAAKAVMFKDEVTLAKIMKCDLRDPDFAKEHSKWTDCPREQKLLGRQVAGFQKERWELDAFDTVYNGNYAKFTQNPDLWAFLDATGEDHLAESNPKDPIWGIALGREDPKAWDPAQWQGLNWLGEVLMDVRQRIREEIEGVHDKVKTAKTRAKQMYMDGKNVYGVGIGEKDGKPCLNIYAVDPAQVKEEEIFGVPLNVKAGAMPIAN